MANGFEPYPAYATDDSRYSLRSYLVNHDSGALTDLDRENAHFYISELLIGALERMKCDSRSSSDQRLPPPLTDSQACSPKSSPADNSSRSGQSIVEDCWAENGRCVANTEQISESPGMHLHLHAAGTSADFTHANGLAVPDSLAGMRRRQRCSLPTSLSSSLPTSVDECEEKNRLITTLDFAELDRLPLTIYSHFNSPQEILSDHPPLARLRLDTSAEAIAFALLDKFADRYIPAIEDFDWLVTWDQAPQQLLPLPRAISIGGTSSSGGADTISSLFQSSCYPFSRKHSRRPSMEPSMALPPDFLRDRSSSSSSSYALTSGSHSNLVSSSPANYPHHSRLRGNSEWAPPRAQIIYNLYNLQPVSASGRRIAIAKQNNRCAGCGVKQETVDAHRRMQLCEYYGKYFCTLCHAGSTAIIPARILHRWDFGSYSVCNIAHSLLQQITDEPVFDIAATNPTLYRKSRALMETYELRRVIQQLVPYLSACVAANKVKSLCETPSRGQNTGAVATGSTSNSGWRGSRLYSTLRWSKYPAVGESSSPPPAPALSSIPSFMTQNSVSLHAYSLRAFWDVKSGRMRMRLERFVALSFQHIRVCSVCQANGHVCEGCHKKDVIFPFNTSKVQRCSKCGACFHRKCFEELMEEKKQCPRCERRERRRARSITRGADKQPSDVATKSETKIERSDSIETLSASKN